MVLTNHNDTKRPIPKLVPVKKAGALKHGDIMEDSELFIFRIPNGLFDHKDLINKDIEFGGKKPSKMTVNGKTFELVTRPLDGQDMTPWLPDSDGILRPVTAPVLGEVTVRLSLSKPSDMTATSDRLNHLAPVEHLPPDLPAREFFGPNNYGPAMFTNGTHKFNKPIVGKSRRKVVSASTTTVTERCPVKTDYEVVAATNTPVNAAATVKRKMSLEEITPQVQQKPFKKKKRDPLVTDFKNVFQDICMTPAPGPLSKADSGHNSESSTKKTKKNKKDKSPKKEVEGMKEEYDADEAVNMEAIVSDVLAEKPKKKKKNKKSSENLSTSPSILSQTDTIQASLSPKKSKKQHQDNNVTIVAETTPEASSTKKKKKKNKKESLNGEAAVSTPPSAGPKGLRAFYLTQSTDGNHQPKKIKLQPSDEV